MDLQRRKLWGDRVTWVLAVAATVVVVSQYVTRGGSIRLYLLIGWSAVMAFLVFFTELRIGRKQPDAGPHAFFAGVASYIGEELIEPDGDRKHAWSGSVPGVLRTARDGIVWTAGDPEESPTEVNVAWDDFWSWRLRGVIPFLGRASGYLVVRRASAREHVFHVSAVSRWRRALRQGAIVGPTYLPPLEEAGVAAASYPRSLVEASAAAPAAAAEEARAIPAEPVAAPQAGHPPPRREPEPEPERPSSPEPGRATEEEPGRATDPHREPETEAAAVPQDTVAASAPKGGFEAVIGLECHVELSTNSKVFCGCPTGFGAEPNTQICPVCTGQPGSLPVINAKAVEYAIRIATALECSVAPWSQFHRKNYFYPDMPKNYQISQYDVPLASAGRLDVEVDGAVRTIRVHRVHLEEDTGKTTHKGQSGRIGGADYALVDYNRAGVPLVEIVSEPDIRSPDEARAYLTELRSLLAWIGVSDVRMEEGSLRCDANVSVRPVGQTELGVKVEVKNMNSIRSVGRALAYEIERLTKLAEAGEEIVQETRHFDESSGRTIAGRSKEFSADYRYFPDPDLVPLAPEQGFVDAIKSGIPELPAARRRRFVETLRLPEQTAGALVATRELADAFEAAAVAYDGEATAIARWYLGELARVARESERPVHELVAPSAVAELQQLIDGQTVTDTAAKTTVLSAMVESGSSPRAIVEESGLQAADDSELDRIVEEVLAANPDVVESVKSGKLNAVGPLIGKVVEASGRTADPKRARALLLEKIGVD